MQKLFNKSFLYVALGGILGMIGAGLGVRFAEGRVPYTREVVGAGLFGAGSFAWSQANSSDMKKVATGFASVGGTVIGTSLYKRVAGKSLPGLEDTNESIA